jgi:hypothetical protein
MKKDAYYFPHDSNAKDDPKCTMLIEQLGLEGYGIFWILIETLRDQPDYKYPIKLLPSLARKYNTTFDKMNIVVSGYGLFEIESETFFYSHSLNFRMEALDEYREKQRVKAFKRHHPATALPGDNRGNAKPMPVEYSIVKNSTVYNIKEYENIESDDKYLFMDFVLLKISEYKKLVERHGEQPANIMIEKINSWFQADEKRLNKYSSHYGCINNWVIDWYRKEYPFIQLQKPEVKEKESLARMTADLKAQGYTEGL